MDDVLRRAASLIDDVIVAVSTPPGRGAVGIVRLSGAPDRTATIVRGLLGDRTLRDRRVALVDVLDAGGEPLDRGLAVRFEAPRSYTGEEVVELQLHGSPAVLAAVVDRACALGARAAGPGEFTRRAVLHGRVDLVEAEAIDAIVRSESAEAAKVARRHLGGELQRSLVGLRDDLVEIAAAVEASVDFPEEIEPDELAPDFARLGPARERLARLEASFEAGRRAVDGVRVVLTGPVNAGKSTLFNALVGHDRAIVSDEPGTTRDIVSETVVWDGLVVRLEDTAGVREAESAVERMGILRTSAALRNADLVVEVRDGRDPGPRPRSPVVVATRGDLLDPVDQARLYAGTWTVVSPGNVEALKLRLLTALRTDAPAGELLLHTARQRDAVRRAGESLDAAVSAGLEEPVLAAIGLRDAGRALEELVGRWVDEAVLDRLFERFCIGK